MGQISDIIDVTLSRAAATPRRPGFGVPLIMGWVDLPSLVTTVTDADELIDAGVPTTDPIYLSTLALFSQEPSPSQVKIGRRLSDAPTQTIQLTVLPTVLPGATVSVRIGGEVASYTLGPSEDAEDARDGLVAAINALDVDVTAAPETPPTDLEVEADAAGEFFAFDGLENVAILSDETDGSADLADDLAAIRNQDDDWYLALHPQDQSSALAVALAAQIEPLTKLFLHQTADRSVLDTGSDTDVGSLLQSSAYFRTATLWHHEVGTGAAPAWAGRILPENPGSLTWAHKTLRGVEVSRRPLLTPTGIGALRAKNVNYYSQVAGLNLTFEGWAASGEWLDTMRGSDWFVAELEAGQVGLSASRPKIPYTDEGIDLIRSMALGKADLGIRRGFLAPDPEPTFTVPGALEQDAQDRADRVLRDAVLTARIAGAIHKTTLRVRLTD